MYCKSRYPNNDVIRNNKFKKIKKLNDFQTNFKKFLSNEFSN